MPTNQQINQNREKVIDEMNYRIYAQQPKRRIEDLIHEKRLVFYFKLLKLSSPQIQDVHSSDLQSLEGSKNLAHYEIVIDQLRFDVILN